MTQNDLILKALKRGRTLTPLDGLKIAGSLKLASRISELAREGHNIKKQWKEQNGKRFMTYRMVK